MYREVLWRILNSSGHIKCLLFGVWRSFLKKSFYDKRAVSVEKAIACFLKFQGSFCKAKNREVLLMLRLFFKLIEIVALSLIKNMFVEKEHVF